MEYDSRSQHWRHTVLWMSAVCYSTGSESRHYLYCSIFSTRLLNLNTETVHHWNVFVLFMSHFQALDTKQHLLTFCFVWTIALIAKSFLICSWSISLSVPVCYNELCHWRWTRSLPASFSIWWQNALQSSTSVVNAKIYVLQKRSWTKIISSSICVGMEKKTL